MNVTATNEPCMILETVELLYAFINELPAGELTAPGPYTIPSSELQHMLTSATEGISRQDPAMQFFFLKEPLQDGSGLFTCLARAVVYNTMDFSCKTSQINYFDIDGRLYFTDLPGYGYAKVSKEERDRWGRLMERYFAEEGLITLGVLIVDARHKPTADDVTMCDWFKGTGCPVIVVANKLDKLKKSEIEPNLTLIRQTLTLPEEALLIPFSAEKGTGKTELLAAISEIYGK